MPPKDRATLPQAPEGPHPDNAYAQVCWVYGWYVLALANVLFMLDPPPAIVWCFINGVGGGLVYLAWWIERRHRRRAR